MSGAADQRNMAMGGYNNPGMGGNPGMQQGGYQGVPQYDAQYPNGGMPTGPNDGKDVVEKLKKGEVKWKIVFFTCSVVVLASAVISVLSLFMSLEFDFHFIDEIYIMAFGLIMMIVDFPKSEENARDHRATIQKYFLFLNLFVGRGLTYIFLSTMVYTTLHDNEISPFLGYVLGGYVFLVGVASLAIGIHRGVTLKKLKENLNKSNRFAQWPQPHGQDVSVTDFRQYAKEFQLNIFNEYELEFVFEGIRQEPFAPNTPVEMMTCTQAQFKGWLDVMGAPIF